MAADTYSPDLLLPLSYLQGIVDLLAPSHKAEKLMHKKKRLVQVRCGLHYGGSNTVAAVCWPDSLIVSTLAWYGHLQFSRCYGIGRPLRILGFCWPSILSDLWMLPTSTGLQPCHCLHC